MLAGRYAAALARGIQPTPAPRASANGCLTHYITHAESKRFQPANITFDLLPPLEDDLRRRIRDKKVRHRIQCERALAAFDSWFQQWLRQLAEFLFALNFSASGLRIYFCDEAESMSLRDLFLDVLTTLWSHKLRTVLTMFGIAWGVISIVLMVAAGEGLRVGQAGAAAELRAAI